MSEKQVGGVTYQAATEGYFEKRELKRHARIWSLWALGVGAVISGQFSGWNFGIASGGWGGLFLAALIIAVMYLGLSFSLAEMSPALPHTGGAYQLQDPAYRKGVYAALAWYVAGILYFAIVGRHRLVLSPEEEFALSKGQSAPPTVLAESATAGSSSS